MTAAILKKKQMVTAARFFPNSALSRCLSIFLFWAAVSGCGMEHSSDTFNNGTATAGSTKRTTGTAGGAGATGTSQSSVAGAPWKVYFWQTYPIRVYFDSAFSSEETTAMRAAMATWEGVVGTKLFTVVSEADGQASGAFGLLSEPDSSKFSSSQVYATTQTKPDGSGLHIGWAQILFNSSLYDWKDTLSLDDSSPVADIQSVATHELGHFLGFGHTDPTVEPDSVMIPTLVSSDGYAKRRLSEADVARVQAAYGCGQPACTAATAAAKEATQTGVNSTTQDQVTAWWLAKDCQDLLLKFGPLRGGIYTFEDSGNGSGTITYNCSGFVANISGS